MYYVTQQNKVGQENKSYANKFAIEFKKQSERVGVSGREDGRQSWKEKWEQEVYLLSFVPHQQNRFLLKVICKVINQNEFFRVSAGAAVQAAGWM